MNSAPCVILVGPQMGENIGAAARAMLNFGLTEMRLVAPRDGWPNQAAIDMAAGAFDIIDDPPVFPTLADAIADLQYVTATTARSRAMAKAVLPPHEAAHNLAEKAAAGQRTGIVFGRERSGLENDEIALCHDIIAIPANPAFSSFNLGQAVLLCAYEWFLQNVGEPVEQTHTPAPQGPVDELWARLQTELEGAGFFRDDGQKPTMIRNLRTMLVRAQMSEQEVRTFHGVISALTGKKQQP